MSDWEAFIDSLAGEKPETRTTAVETRFPCGQCAGTGTYQGRRTMQAKVHCFACKGKGYFLTDPTRRQKAKDAARARKIKAWDAFVEQHQPTIKAIAEIAGEGWNSFAASLHEQTLARKPWSDRQIAAALSMLAKLDQKRVEREERREAEKVEIDLAPIRAMFDTAVKNGYKRPTYRAEGLVISLAPSNGSNPGALYVKNDETAYGGKVAGTTFHPSRDGKQADFAEGRTAADALAEIAKDPLAAALRWGQRTGRCSCCGRELTNHTSIDLGIGPVCREKWGL